MSSTPLPSRDVGPPVVDDPGGFWIDASNNIVGLFNDKISGFPALVDQQLLGNPDGDDWERFKPSTFDIDPNKSDAGTALYLVEYGDDSLRMVVAAWAINRAASRPDKNTDIRFLFGPRTDIPDYSPPDLYPYKRKRRQGIIVQPYAELAFTCLSSPRLGAGLPKAIASQGMASSKSHIVIMPLCMFDFWGPILCRGGLLRLIREITTYISDRTQNTLPPTSSFPDDVRQRVNRVAVSGFSAGATDSIKLFRYANASDLTASYEKEKRDREAQSFAARLRSCKTQFWESPAADLDKTWAEFYSVDGYYGSNTYQAFPSELAPWFASDSERILRIYATPGRMSAATDVIKNKLPDVFKGVDPPKPVTSSKDPNVTAEEWHRSDGRASLVWFSQAYLAFPKASLWVKNDGYVHHLVPRIVFSHAISQSRMVNM